MKKKDLPYLVRPMRLSDIERVIEIERASFPTPWPASAYRYELRYNDRAHYLVAEARVLPQGEDFSEREKGLRVKLRQLLSGPGSPSSIVGYSGFWLTATEGHISTLAVQPEHRERGIGELLLATMIERAVELGAEAMTLEVRVSNHVALKLYRKYGFAQVGLRPRYYSDNREDALIMGTDTLTSPHFQARFRNLRAALREKLRASAKLALRPEAIPGSNSKGEKQVPPRLASP